MKISADYPKNTHYLVRHFDANVVNVGIPIKLKLNNGWALKEDAVHRALPGGAARRILHQPRPVRHQRPHASATRTCTRFDLFRAAGINFNFSEAVGLFVQTGQHYPLTARSTA